jgi:nicotinamide-nucleotide amidase
MEEKFMMLNEIAIALRKKNQSIAVAESCTGGLLAAALTRLPGASDYFLAGVVSYANSVKTNLLGVDAKMLEEFGAVSAPVAVAMAQGVRSRCGAKVALSITGIAGPASDDTQKPVGLVYICLADSSQSQVNEYHFAGDRAGIQQQSVNTALTMLKKYLN